MIYFYVKVNEKIRMSENSAPNMLAYIKRCQKSWARITEARNMLANRERGVAKIIGLLDDAIAMLEENLDFEDGAPTPEEDEQEYDYE
jgi:hypothetical protein